MFVVTTWRAESRFTWQQSSGPGSLGGATLTAMLDILTVGVAIAQ
jgi:hypothetical protein